MRQNNEYKISFTIKDKNGNPVEINAFSSFSIDVLKNNSVLKNYTSVTKEDTYTASIVLDSTVTANTGLITISGYGVTPNEDINIFIGNFEINPIKQDTEAIVIPGSEEYKIQMQYYDDEIILSLSAISDLKFHVYDESGLEIKTYEKNSSENAPIVTVDDNTAQITIGYPFTEENTPFYITTSGIYNGLYFENFLNNYTNPIEDFRQYKGELYERIYFSLSELFNIVDSKSTLILGIINTPDNMKDGMQIPSFNKSMFDYYCRNAVFEVYSAINFLNNGLEDIEELQGYKPYEYKGTILETSEEVTIIRFLLPENPNLNIIPLLKKKVKEAIIANILAGWYFDIGFADKAKSQNSYYESLIQDVRNLAFRLNKEKSKKKYNAL